jgi:formylglycine-generating enzyme required for sulfatase activity
VGTKKPNPWGLFDMHGNVSEWVLDAHDKGFYATLGPRARDPVRWPSEPYPHVVRGGSWDDDAEKLRSAARRGSSQGWKIQDPQIPKSIWYLTNARFVGFRVVRPLHPPPPEEWARYFEPDVESIREVLEKQRQGGR